MSTYTCEDCGGMASTLALCPGCGAVARNIDELGNVGGMIRTMAPLFLAVFALLLAFPSGMSAISSYKMRVARNEIVRDSLRRIESERQQAEEHRILVARADSILHTIPRTRIAKLTTEQINSDLAIVDSRSDTVARRWTNAATKELKKRSANKTRRPNR